MHTGATCPPGQRVWKGLSLGSRVPTSCRLCVSASLRVGKPWAQPDGGIRVPLREEQRPLHGTPEDKVASGRSRGWGHIRASPNNHTRVHTRAHLPTQTHSSTQSPACCWTHTHGCNHRHLVTHSQRNTPPLASSHVLADIPAHRDQEDMHSCVCAPTQMACTQGAKAEPMHTGTERHSQAWKSPTRLTRVRAQASTTLLFQPQPLGHNRSGGGGSRVSGRLGLPTQGR